MIKNNLKLKIAYNLILTVGNFFAFNGFLRKRDYGFIKLLAFGFGVYYYF